MIFLPFSMKFKGGWWPPQGHVLQPSRFSPVLCECIGPRTPITEAIREVHPSFSHPISQPLKYFSQSLRDFSQPLGDLSQSIQGPHPNLNQVLKSLCKAFQGLS